MVAKMMPNTNIPVKINAGTVLFSKPFTSNTNMYIMVPTNNSNKHTSKQEVDAMNTEMKQLRLVCASSSARVLLKISN